jgi:hypothetical protein
LWAAAPIVFAILLLILALQWFWEIRAEFYALDNLGQNWALEAKKEIRSLNPRISVSKKVRLTHPFKIQQMIRIYNFFQKFKRQS